MKFLIKIMIITKIKQEDQYSHKTNNKPSLISKMSYSIRKCWYLFLSLIFILM